MSLSCKRPALWAPGAIPTVNFLLHHFAVVVKKVDVKSHDRTRRRIAQRLAELCRVRSSTHSGYRRNGSATPSGMPVRVAFITMARKL